MRKRSVKYTVDKGTKNIVKLLLTTIPDRNRRKKAGTYTEFDAKVDDAISKAEKDIKLEGYRGKERREMITKIRTSIARDIPYENIENTYCCRNVFYRYRREYSYLVAMHMGMITEG